MGAETNYTNQVNQLLIMLIPIGTKPYLYNL